MIQNIVIDTEFQALIPALQPEERAQLEANILADGCRDPLVLWPCATFDVPLCDGSTQTLHYSHGRYELPHYEGEEGGSVWDLGADIADNSDCGLGGDTITHEEWPHILIDGHNRYEICTRLGLPFETLTQDFADRDAVMDWMDANQLGRRNITPDQFTLLLGRRYNRAKKAQFSRPGNDSASKRDGQNVQRDIQTTAEKLAVEHGVDERTVRRAGQYAEAVAIVEKAVPGFTQAITPTRQAVIKAAAIMEKSPEKAAEILSGAKTISDIKNEEKIEARAALIQKQRDDIEQGVSALPDGVFEVVAMDPPWNYGREYDPDGSRVANPYPEMTQAQLLELEPPFADDSILFLWTTHQFIWDAKALLEKWGFTYKATVVWDKERIGMGHWVRMQCEFCLVAIKGKPTWDNTTWRDIIRETRREHSRKPDAFYAMVEGVTVGRRLEYFSREQRTGWEVFGNDTEKF